MFSAERGGADLGLLHGALSTPNEDVIQSAWELNSQNTAGEAREYQQQDGNSPSISHLHHGLLQPTLLIIYSQEQ